MGAAVRATPTRAPSLLPPGMQITASVIGLSGIVPGHSTLPAYFYQLTPPFEAGTAAITLIDADSGLPSSLAPTDQPLNLAYSGFEPGEALNLALYYLVRPKRQTADGELLIQASPIAAARVAADASGSAQQMLDVPRCAPPGDYLIVACRGADCSQAAEGTARSSAAWLKFLRAAPVAPEESPPPHPDLAIVDADSAFDGLNVRAGPGVANPILHHLDPSAVVEVTGPADDSPGAPWFPVRDAVTCTEGWVNGNFLAWEDSPVP